MTGSVTAWALGVFPNTKTKVKLNFYPELGAMQLLKVPSSCLTSHNLVQLLVPFQSLSLPLPRACLDSVTVSIGQLSTSQALEAEKCHQASSLQLRSVGSTHPQRSTFLMQMCPFSGTHWITCTIPHPKSHGLSSHLGSAWPHSPGSPGSPNPSCEARLLAPALGTAMPDSCPSEDESNVGRPFMEEISISQQMLKNTPQYCIRNQEKY